MWPWFQKSRNVWEYEQKYTNFLTAELFELLKEISKTQRN